MASFITIKSIDQAISNLNYEEKKTLRRRLVDTIRQFYESHSSAESLAGIPTEALVRALWVAGDDPEVMRLRRKNLSSIKYSVNVHLRRLYREGKNPEGIIIGRNNIFVMSDEAKDRLLGAFRNFMKKQGLGALSQVAEIFTLLNELVSSPGTPEDRNGVDGLSGKIRQLKDLVRGLSEKEDSDAEELADFAAEAFMTLSMGKETVGATDTPEVSDEPGDIAQDEPSKDRPAERLGEVVQEAELAQAIEALDEGQLEEDGD